MAGCSVETATWDNRSNQRETFVKLDPISYFVLSETALLCHPLNSHTGIIIRSLNIRRNMENNRKNVRKNLFFEP